MNREIKFRAFVNNEMIYSDGTISGKEKLSLIFEDGFWFYKMEGEGGQSDSWKIDDEEIMQFTGLHDSKGVEIYEGDIVKYGDNIEEVIFIDGMFKVIDWDLITATMVEGGCEVIGNIYQNKDLIN